MEAPKIEAEPCDSASVIHLFTNVLEQDKSSRAMPSKGELPWGPDFLLVPFYLRNQLSPGRHPGTPPPSICGDLSSWALALIVTLLHEDQSRCMEQIFPNRERESGESQPGSK